MTDYDEYKFEIAEQQEQIDKHFQTRYINLFNMIENFKKRWVGFDELWTRCFSSHNPYDRDLFVSNNENFVDYLEHCVNSLSTGSSSKWKWAAISFHGALYCAIVEAISIEWGQQQTITRRNQIKGYGKLVDFLLKKYSDDVGTYNLPELFDDDPYEQNIERIILQKALPSIRNSFAHFNLEPFLWHTNGLAHMFLIALLPLTRLVVHWNIEWDSLHKVRIISSLQRLSHLLLLEQIHNHGHFTEADMNNQLNQLNEFAERIKNMEPPDF